MTHESHRRSDRILVEIDRTRAQMDRTLSEIEQRLSPQELLNQGLSYVRHSGATEFAQNLGGAAKQNPLPVALVGIGIAWLMALGRQPAYQDGDSLRAEYTGDENGSVTDKMASAADRVGEGISSMKDRASEKLSSMGVRARATGSTVRETTREQWDRARSGLDTFVQEQPLLLGAIGLAVGAALGASAPRTRQEEQLLGEASRKVAERVKDVGGEQLAKAREMVNARLEKSTQSPQSRMAEPAERGSGQSGNGGTSTSPAGNS
ncbi:MAG TPA: DUF3618 domain-containing protein [Vicinamibacterales bacterium]|nr:DUF3618 domain-containing protein [Vicinamibacterales bacterium]